MRANTTKEKIIVAAGSLSAFAVLAAGIIMLSGGGLSVGYLLIGLIVCLFGVLGISLIIAAGVTRKHTIEKAYKYIGIGFMLMVVISAMDLGIISGLEWFSLIIIGMMVLTTWKAIRTLVIIPNLEEKAGTPNQAL